jgi:hypothetical protein
LAHAGFLVWQQMCVTSHKTYRTAIGGPGDHAKTKSCGSGKYNRNGCAAT